MKKGDFVFHNDKLIAKTNRNVPLEKGMVWNVSLLSSKAHYEPVSAVDLMGRRCSATFRSIFNLDGVQHWAIFLYGDATVEDAFRSGWIVAYDVAMKVKKNG